MQLKGKKVLVTGGAGFIGSHLVDALMQEDCFVVVIDNLTNGKLDNLKQHSEDPRFEFILGSVNHKGDLSKAMQNIDIVFHLACLGVRHSIKYPFENHQVNAEGTLQVLEEARKEKVERFIYCSSSEVYGTAEYVPMPENHPTHPCTVYGAGKLVGEAYARAFHKTYGLKTTMIRLFNTFGPRSHHEGDAGEMIPKSIVRAFSGKPILIFGDGSQTRDFIYVEDSVQGLIEASKCDDTVGGTYNIGSGSEISIKQLADMILERIEGSSAGIEFVKSRPGDVSRLYADATVFRGMTEWRPRVSFQSGLDKTIEWFKSSPKGIRNLLAEETGMNWA